MFVVITRTAFPVALADKALGIARDSAPVFRRQTGLVALDTFLASDKNSLSTVFRWRDKAAHEACMQSADFAALNGQWSELFASGEVSFEMWTGDPI